MQTADRVRTSLKATLRAAGYGLHGLGQSFKAMDVDGSGALSWEEFMGGLNGAGLTPSVPQVRALFQELDVNGDGQVSWPEFMASMREELSPARRELIVRIFESIDKDCDGLITMTDIGECFCPQGHPDVKAGRISTINLLRDFLETFSTVSEHGVVTLAQFLEYYEIIAAYDDESTFAQNMTSVWKIDPARAQAHAQASASKAGQPKSLRSFASQQLAASASGLESSTSSVKTDSPIQAILDALRGQLVSRGAHGIIGLQRKFRIIDDDGSKSINFAEFRKAIKEMALALSEQQMTDLFRYMDKDSSGTLNFDEFLVGVRGPMDARRKALVNQAFDVLDGDRNGVIEPSDLVGKYDASKHPEVIAGRKSPEAVLREFLDTFDVGGEVDGKVTRDEFVNYYANISASIDDDDYFELMIRNAWHISGGTGWSANSANRRVLVTRSDGSQVVEEIKNDLGLKANDKAGMMARLKAQGVDASNISLYDGGDDNSKATKFGTKPAATGGAATRSGKPARAVAPESKALSELAAKMQDATINESQMIALAGPGAASSSGAAVGPSSPSSSKLGGGAIVDAQANANMSAGVRHIVDRLKKELKSRGAGGLIGLQRKFRIIDDDGSKSLSLAEFKKSMAEMNISLADSELRLLFNFFDADHSGTIDFEEFVQGVRDPLTKRRLDLVYQAFDQIDIDGNGVVDGAEIAQIYDASKHPEVIAGRKMPQEVLREFLETFDVGGEVDGKVTRDEFVNYYTSISASIDNEDYFELMIRNAWHISGGTGWSANSANRRVLVTRADGSQAVEEIQKDLGLKANDKAGMMARLKAQGVDAANISLYDGGDDNSKATKFGTKPAATLSSAPKKVKNLASVEKARVADSSGSSLRAGGKSSSGAPSAEVKSDVAVALLGPSLRASSAPSFQASSARSGSGGGGGTFSTSTIPPGVSLILSRLKEAIKARGSIGFIGLQRKFKIIDDDGSKSLDLGEFKKAMKEMDLAQADSDIRAIFAYFDKDGSGSIDFEEFVQGVRDPLSDRRLSLVKQAFAKIDVDGNGMVDAEEISLNYDASKHPDVVSGKRTEQSVMREFLSTFDVGGEVDGKVTMDEFVNYYTNLGASIDNEDYFELMIRNAWHISGGTGWSANSANRRVLVTRSDGSQYVEEIKNDLGLKSDDKAGMLARLKAQGVDAANISLFDGGDDNSKGPASNAQRPSSSSSVRRTGRRAFAGFGAQSSLTAPGVLPGTADTLSAPKTARPIKPGKPTPPSIGILGLVSKLKAELASRGARGIIGLQRKFRIIDDDGSRSISLAEFKKAMTETNMGLNESDLRVLFNYFDADHSGSIDFEEFVQGLRDPLTPRRLDLVKQAFAKIDTDGSGVVDAAEIAQIYDASKHPEVIAGRMTPEHVLQEFLETFDVGGEVDGKVTMDEFVNYYTNLGASIDNEDYFELMIRNAWHISGGTGWSANSANRRVLVTRTDGSQAVEEIKNDLGLKANDKAGMMARLKAQGVDASNISLYDGGDDNSKATKFGARPATAPAASSKKKSGTQYWGSTSSQFGSWFKDEQDAKKAQQDADDAAAAAASSSSNNPASNAPADVAAIIVRLKQEIKNRGSLGFIGLQRKFRIIDDDGSRTLSLAEFKKAMKEMRMGLSESELRLLFGYFDSDHSGSIDFEEFVQGLRDPLTPRRLDLVKQAFAKIDVDGSGVVDAAEIAQNYDASKHPDVIAQKKTADEVLVEFLSTFDVGGEVDGKVTMDEFVNYYTNLGASIDNEDYFELMIRNAWHISGGTGWSANSANRRVLVAADGSEQVVEIKNDLGLKSDDMAGIKARLRAQGVAGASHVYLFGGGGDDEDGSESFDVFGERVSRKRRVPPKPRTDETIDKLFGSGEEAKPAPKPKPAPDAQLDTRSMQQRLFNSDKTMGAAAGSGRKVVNSQHVSQWKLS